MTDRERDPNEQQRRQTGPGELFDALRDGRISRRRFIIRAAALGFSASAINAFLIACGGGGGNTTTTTTTTAATTTTTTTARTTTAPGAGLTTTTTTAGTARTTTGTTGAARTTGTTTRGTAAASRGGYDRNNPPAFTNAAAARQFSGQQLSYIGGQVGSDADLDQILSRKFQEETGIRVNVTPGPEGANERYAQYQRIFQSSSADLDVMMLDVIWPGAFAQFLIDLNPRLGDLARQCYPSIIENNTVDGRLVGMPWFGDFGMLFYRTDLLQKYNISAPPRTWQELQQQAQRIQEGERGGNPNFSGFVFQGAAYEGLTCNALEWLASNGAGRFVENGQVTINSPQGVQVMDLIKSFVGTIAPRGVTTFQENETVAAFTGGNAAFARNWPFMYALGQRAEAVRGKFDVAPLPAAQGQRNVGTLGGWQLGVSRFSRNQDAATEFVRYMCSPEVVTWRAVVASYVPLYPNVADDPDVVQANPYLRALANVERVTRPSRDLAENYNEGSTAIYQSVNQILTGGDTGQSLQRADQTLRRVVRRR